MKQKKRKNDGTGFEREISNSLKLLTDKYENFYWERLSDYHSWVTINPLLVHPKSTADFFSLYKGVAVYLEAKSSESPTRFTLFHSKGGVIEPTLKAHQKSRGLEITRAGGRYFVLINLRIPRHNRVFVFDVRAYNQMEMEVEKGMRKNIRSISWSEIEDIYLRSGKCVEISLGKGKIWNLSLIYDKL